ncbi:MAG: hypothetical protein KA240_18155 [Nitrospira sp.]|nr:hypothetical protein [Nitrospira sp.]MBP6607606.1 hypothetical protein [Nitrospira sp.]HQY57081.1 hypothetical protein [Nitrospira sp.]HRA96916.1 hypothetical protein [Nitrospira sp.]
MTPVGGGGCKGTHPVPGQVREEQVLVTLPPEFFAGQLPKGQIFTQQDQGWTWTFTPVRRESVPGFPALSFLSWHPLDHCGMMNI